MPITNREVHLVRRPDGMPVPEDFSVVEAELPDIAPGQFRVKNLCLSIDPAMRPRLSAGQALDEPMAGGAIGRVVQSLNPEFAEGDYVMHRWSFREYANLDGRGAQKLAVDAALSPSVYMHVLGGSGFVAYGGLLAIGKMKDGEQVFVSTAAGSVGSVAVQVAKIHDCYVIGSTGSDEKCRWLTEDLGVDVAINYKKEPIRTALKAAAPRGIDVYFDNVGGDHLNAALPRMNVLGRIPVCGMISAYNNFGAISDPVTTLSNIIYGRITIRGFVGADFPELKPAFDEEMTAWVKSGRVKYQETFYDGIENAGPAIIGMLNGVNTGKMMVRLAE